MLCIIAFAQEFVKEGIDVIIATDGKTWLHTKRTSIKHTADQECAHIIALRARQELLILLQSNSADKEKITKLQKWIKTNENGTNNALPDDFIEVLWEQVKHLKSLPLDANVTLKVAQHQADPMISRIILEGEADAIVSSDSDYSVYLGHHCLCIKGYKYRARDGIL